LFKTIINGGITMAKKKQKNELKNDTANDKKKKLK